MGYLSAALTSKTFSEEDFKSLTEDVRNRILSVSTPERIYIFGSHARGSITEISDLDLAIIFKDVLDLKSQKKIILNSRLFLDYTTDILFYTLEEFQKKASIGGVCYVILNEGKIIYDKRTAV